MCFPFKVYVYFIRKLQDVKMPRIFSRRNRHRLHCSHRPSLTTRLKGGCIFEICYSIVIDFSLLYSICRNNIFTDPLQPFIGVCIQRPHAFSVAGDSPRNLGSGCSNVWNPLHGFTLRYCISRSSDRKLYRCLARGVAER
jgi:hypothetical protein